MREVILQISCDDCGRPIHGEPPPIKVDVAGTPYETDLCDNCVNTWTIPLRPVPKTKPYQCADCDKAYTTSKSLAQHRGKVHK